MVWQHLRQLYDVSEICSRKRELQKSSSKFANLKNMNKPTRILTAIALTIMLGGMFAYQDAQKNEPAYQQHPVTVILTDFFCGSLSGLIVYFGSGWLARRKERKLNQVTNSHPIGGNRPSNVGDDKFYDAVARELQEESIVPGLWTKAFAEMDGDDAKARALYIRYRVQQLATEAARQQEMAARQHESVDQKRKREIALIRNRLSYLRNLKWGDDERIPNSQFDGIPGTLSHPVNASIVADALGVPNACIVIAIRTGKVTGVRCDGEWFVDLGIV